MRATTKLLSVVCLFSLLAGCSQSSANMETALTTVVENGTAVTLEQITDFEWDKVYVIGPYDQFDYSHISHVPAGARKVIERQIIEERNALLIFTLDDTFVKLYDISVGPVDKLGLTGGVFTPESVIPIKDGADNPDC